jgi:hypothetical protein
MKKILRPFVIAWLTLRIWQLRRAAKRMQAEADESWDYRWAERMNHLALKRCMKATSLEHKKTSMAGRGLQAPTDAADPSVMPAAYSRSAEVGQHD